MDATILICTFNRATWLGSTLDSIATTNYAEGLWDVLVVDNNSTDETRAIVESRQAGFPAALTYAFEGRQGKSWALNTGIQRARGDIIVFTDDDVRVPRGWLNAAVGPLLQRPDIAYTGGPVRPIWEKAAPEWLAMDGNLGGPIAVKDHGREAFIFEEHRKTPLGVNMAVRRQLCESVEGFNPDFGRRGTSLLGQEQAEFFYRSRALGARGLYVPEMALEHHVPAARLTRRYFRRWWYWKGISHAKLHRLHGRTEMGLDLRRVRKWRGVPLYMVRGLFKDGLDALAAFVAGRGRQAAEKEMMAWYALGYIQEALTHRLH